MPALKKCLPPPRFHPPLSPRSQKRLGHGLAQSRVPRRGAHLLPFARLGTKGGGGTVLHVVLGVAWRTAQPQYANYWAPLTRKRHTMPHPAQPRHTNHWSQHKVWGTLHAGLDPRTCRPMDPIMDGGTMDGTGGGRGRPTPRLIDNTEPQLQQIRKTKQTGNTKW